MTSHNFVYMLLGVMITSVSLLSFVVYTQHKKIHLLEQKTDNTASSHTGKANADTTRETSSDYKFHWPYDKVLRHSFRNTVYDKKLEWVNSRASHSLLYVLKIADFKTNNEVVLIVFCRFVKVNKNGSMKLLIEDPYGELWTETFTINLSPSDNAGNFSGRMCEIHGKVIRKKLYVKRVIRLTYGKYID
ncbi:hypothetical protein [Wukongibacter baidiensis]